MTQRVLDHVPQRLLQPRLIRRQLELWHGHDRERSLGGFSLRAETLSHTIEQIPHQHRCPPQWQLSLIGAGKYEQVVNQLRYAASFLEG